MNKKQIIITLLSGIIIGVCIVSFLIETNLHTDYYTKEKCEEILTNQTPEIYRIGFNDGVINTANFTTQTGNFTYIYDEQIQIQNIQEYCVAMTQGVQNG